MKQTETIPQKTKMEKGKIVYNNQKIINGVKYTDEYHNTTDKSKLLTNGRNNPTAFPSSSTSKMINTRYSTKFTLNQNIQINKSLDRNTINSNSLDKFDETRSRSKYNIRRNLKINSSMMIQRNYIKSQLDTSDIQQDLNDLEQQLKVINESYSKSLEGQGLQAHSNNEFTTKIKDGKDDGVNLDSVINKLTGTNKSTLEKLKIISEQINKSIVRLQQEENLEEDPTVKNKEFELRVMQIKCAKYKQKIDSIHLLLDKTSDREFRNINNQNEIVKINGEILELQIKRDTLIKMILDQKQQIHK